MYVNVQGSEHHVVMADSKGERSKAVAGRPTVVMVHGAIADSFASFYLSLHWPLARMGAINLMYDRRAHGRTSYVPHTLTLQQASADLAGILAAVGITEAVHLIGNSYGASIVIDFAIHYPELVASLVLLEGEPPTRQWRAHLLDSIACGMNDADPWKSSVLSGSKGTRHERRVKAVFKAFNETTLFHDLGASRVVDESMLSALTMPILGIFGEESSLNVQSRTVAAMNQLPNFSSVTVPGAGHLLLFDAASQVSDAIVRFLAQHDPRFTPAVQP